MGSIEVYLRLRNLLQAVRELPDGPVLDDAEQHLLEIVTEAWRAGSWLSVTEAMAIESAGAPATVHRRLKRLTHKGLIELISTENDSRMKRISPTADALAYFEKLAKCIENAQR